MQGREPTIREMPPPPHIVGLQHFTRYAEIDEILRSRSFRQGSHQESQPFFGRSLLTIDGDEQLHVSVDHQMCQGVGYCERVADAVFRLGDDGRSHVLDAHPPASERAAVEEAATLCPSRAIRY